MRFQTFGHIHPEEFSVTRSLTSNKPIGVEFIGGNAGTFDFMSPTVRLYEFHGTYHLPLEFSVYRMSIEESNQHDRVVMDRWFDFKRDFDLTDLSPRSHLKLSESFLQNPEQSLRYH